MIYESLGGDIVGKQLRRAAAVQGKIKLRLTSHRPHPHPHFDVLSRINLLEPNSFISFVRIDSDGFSHRSPTSRPTGDFKTHQ